MHTLEQAAGHGHCYVPSGKLIKIAADSVLRVNVELVAARYAELRKAGVLVQHGQRIFTRRLNRAEQRCADRIGAFLRQRASA